MYSELASMENLILVKMVEGWMNGADATQAPRAVE
jgi:hypothetical protein